MQIEADLLPTDQQPESTEYLQFLEGLMLDRLDYYQSDAEY
jgi:hypothetical protein